MKNNRFAALDGLRAIFGMGIVIYHINTWFGSPLPYLLYPVYRYGGYFGNYMFFIISGLLISLRYKERLLNGECSLRQFISKRLRRLYPVYFLSNLAMILWGNVKLSLSKTCATFLMIATGWFYGGDTPYNSPAWFICVLMICYIIYFAVCKISSRFPAAYLFFCCSLVICGAVLEVLDRNIPFLYRVCGEGYMNFFLGALLGDIYTAANAYRQQSPKAKMLVKHLAICTAACVSIALLFLLAFQDMPGDLRWWITFISAGLIIPALSGGVFSRILSILPLQVMGKCSLSLTLWHIPLNQLWQKAVSRLYPSLNINVSFILYLLFTISISLLSYRFLEQMLRKTR